MTQASSANKVSGDGLGNLHVEKHVVGLLAPLHALSVLLLLPFSSPSSLVAKVGGVPRVAGTFLPDDGSAVTGFPSLLPSARWRGLGPRAPVRLRSLPLYMKQDTNYEDGVANEGREMSELTPAAARFFEDVGIQPGYIHGSGKNGRVLLSDAKMFMETNPNARFFDVVSEMRKDFVKRSYGFELNDRSLLRTAFSASTAADRIAFFKIEKLGIALIVLVAAEQLYTPDRIGVHGPLAQIKDRNLHAGVVQRHLARWISSLKNVDQRREALAALHPAPQQVTETIEISLRGPDLLGNPNETLVTLNPNRPLAALHCSILGTMAILDLEAARKAVLKDIDSDLLAAQGQLQSRKNEVDSFPDQHKVLESLASYIRPDLVAEVWRRTTDLEVLGDAVLTFLLMKRLLPLCEDESEFHRARNLFGENNYLALRIFRRLHAIGGLPFFYRWYKQGERELPDRTSLTKWINTRRSVFDDARKARQLGLRKGALSDFYETMLGAKFLTGGIEAAEALLANDLPSDDEIQAILREEWALLPAGATDLSIFAGEKELFEALGHRLDPELQLRGLPTIGTPEEKAATLWKIRNTKVENFKKTQLKNNA